MMFVLEGPNDKAWFVHLKEADNNTLMFDKGWEHFVQDNSLEFGDFLTFRYNGFSKFKVTIYGTNGCEKQLVKETKVRQRGAREESHSDDEVIVLTESDFEVEETMKRNKKRKRRESTSDSSPIRNVQTCTFCIKITFNQKLLWQCTNMYIYRCVGKRPLYKSSKEKLAKQIRKRALYPNGRRSVLQRNHSVAAKAARHFKSNNPHFAVLMTDTYITKGPIVCVTKS